MTENDLKKLCGGIPPLGPEWFQKAQARLDNLTKPRKSLGRLEELAARIVAIQETIRPELTRKRIVVFASDHGVEAEGVSLYPREVTAQMVLNFIHGGAGINVLSRQIGVEVEVVDIGIDHEFEMLPGLKSRKIARGTGNMARGSAMSRLDAIRALGAGIELAREAHRDGVNMIGCGEMGIGNTTPSSAVAAIMTRQPPEKVTGRGTGITRNMWLHKIQVIRRALRLHRPKRSDPLGVLAKVGGFEIGGIAGLILGAASLRIPTVIDGFISGAGALIATGLAPVTKDYLFASHRSVEPGHRHALKTLGLKPLLELDLRLGEGTGAVLAMSLIESGVNILNEMASFDEAGVSTADKG